MYKQQNENAVYRSSFGTRRVTVFHSFVSTGANDRDRRYGLCGPKANVNCQALYNTISRRWYNEMLR